MIPWFFILPVIVWLLCKISKTCPDISSDSSPPVPVYLYLKNYSLGPLTMKFTYLLMEHNSKKFPSSILNLLEIKMATFWSFRQILFLARRNTFNSLIHIVDIELGWNLQTFSDVCMNFSSMLTMAYVLIAGIAQGAINGFFCMPKNFHLCWFRTSTWNVVFF